MTTLNDHVDDYLRLRRALGFKLERAGWLLPQLVAYVEATGTSSGSTRLSGESGFGSVVVMVAPAK